MIVTRFGVHWAAGGVAFLHQNKGATHALPVDDLRSPFEVKANNLGLRCPHEIDIDRTAPPPAEFDDPLFRVMLPLPVSPAGPRAWAIDDIDLIETLKALVSPADDVEWSIWWESARIKATRFKLTNIAPMVFRVSSALQTDRVEKVLELAEHSERRVLFVCEGRFPLPGSIQRVTSKLTPAVAHLPLREIGAGALRRYMLTKELPI